jgi:DNA-binding CsgD family transcriptional regulator
MSLLSVLKRKLGVHAAAERSDIVGETESIHTPSFSIGDSLGDIKVALMDLKNRSERIEGSMLSREYLDQSLVRNDKSDLIVSKLDETLRVLAEFQPRKPSIEPSMPGIEPSSPSLEPRIPSPAEEGEPNSLRPTPSLRLQEALTIFQTRQRTTPKQLARLLGIATNTACEHLRRLERLGLVRRVSRGLYEDSRAAVSTRVQL